ncbi:FKBP-type peptidyl-prolyl cis-trans isomerase [Mucilaginibacter sp.]
MKQTIFTLLLLSTIGFMSCRKLGTEPNITQYDQSQILNYIKANGITGMKQDTVGGDTSGIYYKILQPGSGTSLTYSDEVSYVFTLRSFDGLYSSTDTITNQYFGYIGHIASAGLPVGLEIAIMNDLKYSGGSMRVLIPSNLAYGVEGYGTGSTSVAGSHIAGNQCLDYYVHIIDKQPDTVAQYLYDEQVITNYIAAQKLAGYQNDGGVWFKILTPGTGTADPITDNTTIQAQYNERLLDGTVLGGANPTTGVDSTSFDVPTLIPGVTRMLEKHAVKGTVISMIIPSGQAYGTSSPTGTPPNACLRYEFTIVDVSP